MIKITNVSKEYRKTKKLALNNINLEIPDGGIIAILGPNGAGKTTLIKCICSLINYDTGTIEVDGIKVSEKNKKRIMTKIAAVLEGPRNLYWRASVLSNYYYLGMLQGKSRKEIKKNIEEYNGLFNTNNFLKTTVKNLSLGQKQTVSILSALLIKPEILILDEPSNGLDIDSKIDLVNMLAKIRESTGTTIIIASHDVDFVRKIADQLIIISDGQIKGTFINEQLTSEKIEELYENIVH